MRQSIIPPVALCLPYHITTGQPRKSHGHTGNCQPHHKLLRMNFLLFSPCHRRRITICYQCSHFKTFKFQTPNPKSPNSQSQNSKSQTPNSKSQIPSSKSQTPNPKLQTPKPQIPNSKSQIPKIQNPKPQIPNSKSQIPKPSTYVPPFRGRGLHLIHYQRQQYHRQINKRCKHHPSCRLVIILHIKQHRSHKIHHSATHTNYSTNIPG